MLRQDLYFIDIETVPVSEDIPSVPKYRELFEKKFKHLYEPTIEEGFGSTESVIVNEEETWNDIFRQNAGLYAEFAKVVCISIGRQHGDTFYVKAYTDEDEKELLSKASETLKKATLICGHNVKEFDVPFLFRRVLINGLSVPPILNTIGKKPWEVQIEDTLEMWGSTQWRYRCSLDLLCYVLGVQSPKSDIDGSKVAEVYYKEGEAGLKRIAHYCNQDVIADAKVYCKIKGIPEFEKIAIV